MPGGKNVLAAVLKFGSNTKIKIDVCIDYTRPALAIEIEKIDKSFANIKTKGIRVRVLTEIFTDNVSYCKRLSALVHELRHLDGIKGSYYLNESEYLAPAIFHERGYPLENT